MLVRFLSNLFSTLVGSLLLVACFAFRPTVLGWLTLAAGCAVLVVVLGAFPVRGRGAPQRMLDLAALVLAAWTVVAGRAFSGGTLKWTSVGEAFAVLGLGAIGLLMGELELRAALIHAWQRPITEPCRSAAQTGVGRRREHVLGERGRN